MATKRSIAGAPMGAGWDPAWETRDFAIPKERYTDPEFAKLEAEKLWPHVWQMACRIEEVPRPGDYTVYEIVDQEILIIRVDENSIKAYHNVCPHRATTLAVGSGRFSTGEITCPFHGWRWNINGACTFVLDRDEFKGGCLTDEDVALREVQVATWIGCVFINMDKNARPFEEHVAPIRHLVDPLGLENQRVYWWKSVVAPCNWKIAQEAFHEAYHVPGTHPQLGRRALDGGPRGPRSNYASFENGHGCFYSGNEAPSEELKGERRANWRHAQGVEQLVAGLEVLWEGMDAMVFPDEVNIAKTMRNKKIPEGSNLTVEFDKAVRAYYADQGRFIPSAQALSNCGDMLTFPNYTFLPSFGNVLVYRSRPNGTDPDSCIFELWSLKTYPEGENPPRPRCLKMTDVSDPEQYWLIPRQDFSNVPRVQRGLHSRGLDELILAEDQEKIIYNMHRELDKYLMA